MICAYTPQSPVNSVHIYGYEARPHSPVPADRLFIFVRSSLLFADEVTRERMSIVTKPAALPLIMQQLKPAPTVASLWENEDNSLTVKLRSGDDVVIYLLDDERMLVPTPLKTIVRKNTRQHFHTLFVVAESALPPAGGIFDRNALHREALLMLFELYWGKVYAYRVIDGQIVVFPVYNDHWRAVYGDPVEIEHLDCDIVFLEMPFKGVFNVANFSGRFAGSFDHAQSFSHGFDPLQPFYDLLGIVTSASNDDVKRAYRRLARKYHPDTNPSPEAHEMMQRINEAYAKIMERVG